MANQVWRQVRQPDGSYKLELQMDNRPQWVKDQTKAFGGNTVSMEYGMDPATYGAIPEGAQVTDQYGRVITPQTGRQQRIPSRTLLGGGAGAGVPQQAATAAAGAGVVGSPVAAGGGGGGFQSGGRRDLLQGALRKSRAPVGRFGAGRLGGGGTLLGR